MEKVGDILIMGTIFFGVPFFCIGMIYYEWCVYVNKARNTSFRKLVNWKYLDKQQKGKVPNSVS